MISQESVQQSTRGAIAFVYAQSYLVSFGVCNKLQKGVNRVPRGPTPNVIYA